MADASGDVIADAPVPTGIATGIGSLPGSDPLTASRLILDELPDFPHLAELPQRGPGAGLVGRSAALLVDLPVDLQPAGWRLVERPGADQRRAVSMLRQDLDALDEVFEGYTGPIKLQIAGPWTLAATLEKSRGDKVLSDHGARRDLNESLAEGVRLHVAEVARRIPGAQIVLQLDEPGLPAVLAGDVPTISGFGRLRSVDAAAAQTGLAAVINAAGVPVIVHCCASDVPVRLMHQAGAAAIAFDLSIFPRNNAHTGELAEAVEAGVVVVAGAVPTAADSATSADPGGAVGAHRSQVARFWQHLDQPPDGLVASVIISPACGLFGGSVMSARTALRQARNVARALNDDPEPSSVGD
jgi:methionine synthase II (cobalamin-independent)